MIKRIVFDEYGRIREIEFWAEVSGSRVAEEINSLESRLSILRSIRTVGNGPESQEKEVHEQKAVWSVDKS